ncbi:MAG TPA: hypothetical protein VIX89_10020 [Bryobacteraceae bacterium]
MEDKTRKKRYVHQASAIAASGHVTRPCCDLMPTQGALALPGYGGHGSTYVENFRYKEILSFASAYSEVAGSEHGPEGPFDTLTLTAIEKLNILDVVTCDRVVARLSSQRTFDSEEPEITTVGSRFERLRIGHLYFEHLDFSAGVVCECTTWGNLQKTLRDDSKKAAFKQAALSAPDGEAIPIPDGEQMPHMVGFSLAPGSGRAASIRDVPWRIDVPQFGSVFLGEFFISQYTRHLTMLRVELGCPVAGAVLAGSGSGGGDTYP